MRRVWIVALLLGMASPAHAGKILPTDEGVSSALALTGTPATKEGVRRALDGVKRGGPQTAIDLATALGHAGGAAAADGLARLYAYQGADVRPVVLRSACKVGLRRARLLTRIRSALETRSKDIRLSACEAIGRLGDGRDVPLLLDLTADPDPRVRHTAFESLRRLSGAALPNVAARWGQWWRVQQSRADESLAPALRTLDIGAPTAARARLQSDVMRYAWLGLPEVERIVHRWLKSADEANRLLALRLAVDLRLADLGNAILGAHEFASSPAEERAAAAALARLGIRVEARSAEGAEGRPVPRVETPAKPGK